MYDSKSEESNKPGGSDSEFGHPGLSKQDSQRQLGNKLYSHSVNLSKISVSPTGGNIELKPLSRSAHQQGNRGGHVPPEEAEPYNGGKFIETPNLTSQSPHRNTPPTLSCQRSWAIGRGRGRTRVEETKISTGSSMPKNNMKPKKIQYWQFWLPVALLWSYHKLKLKHNTKSSLLCLQYYLINYFLQFYSSANFSSKFLC